MPVKQHRARTSRAWFHAPLLAFLLGLACEIAPSVRGAETTGGPPAAPDTTQPAGPTGPTLRLDYDPKNSPGSPVGDFMYFVALISPEPVSATLNPGNTQRMRVLSCNRHMGDKSFKVSCDLEFAGEGYERNLIDQSNSIRRNEKKLKEGGALNELLVSINIEGHGRATLEAQGSVTNHVPVVNEVKLQFHGQESPVVVALHDVKYVTNSFVAQNEVVARVSSIVFKRQAGPPKMEISLASVKPKDAGNGMWQNFVGGVKGMAANFLLKPVAVEPIGHAAMLDFGLALATRSPAFTFPFAKNLQKTP